MLFIVRDQRTQDQRIRHVIDKTQVSQRLAGDLPQRFTGDQRLHAVALSHFGRRTHHHTFQHHAHLAVVHFFEDFADHRLKVDRHKTHAVRAAEAVPQVMRHLTYADFMRRAAQVKEAVVHAAATTHQHIAGHAGVEPAGDQRQHIFLSADRETANTFITTLDQQQAIVFDLKVNGDVRVSQAHARRFNVLVQTTTDVALNLNRAKLMLTPALHAHAERFPFDLVAVLHQRLFEDIVHIGEGNVFHFQNMVNTRDTGQRVANIKTFVFVFRADFYVVPVTHHGERFVVVF
ncbi:Uncharacterised protein [Enterobacter hormaechei]|nr:Uncharacterised protein [Enterobacter hormaechei]